MQRSLLAVFWNYGTGFAPHFAGGCAAPSVTLTRMKVAAKPDRLWRAFALADRGVRLQSMAVLMMARHKASLLALAAIALWGTLAWFAVQLASVPPFFVVGWALLVAGLWSAPFWWRVRVSLPALLLGVYGLFGFHFFLFMALRYAPPIPANLVNYLWPLLIVLLGTGLRGGALKGGQIAGALLGLLGAALAIGGAGGMSVGLGGSRALLGYALAFVSALIWATYSLGTQQIGKTAHHFPTAAIGMFCGASGILAVCCHALLEPKVSWDGHTGLLLVLLGVGPMGGAFFLWDAALKRGDARAIGSLAYLTPFLSTVLLGLTGHGRLGWSSLGALVLIVAGAALGNRTGRKARIEPGLPSAKERAQTVV